MMTSNAYIATDSKTVMKVGKANNIKRREKQIAVRITHTIACLSSSAAYRVERRLRDFVVKRGGIRHQSTIDWFKFDPQIYAMLCEFAVSLNGQKVAEISIDVEIGMLRARYYELVIAEVAKERDAALERVKWLEGQIEASIQRQKELTEKQEQTRKELERKYEEREQEIIAEYECKERGLLNERKQGRGRGASFGTSLQEKYEGLLRKAGRLDGIIEMMQCREDQYAG